MSDTITPRRAEVFRYVGLDLDGTTVRATYDVDGRTFCETVVFEGAGPLNTPAVLSVAELWFLLAGLSYYKTGAARRIDVGAIPLGVAGRRLLEAALTDGLGEFSYRNDLPLGDVTVEGGGNVTKIPVTLNPQRVLVPFGGGIDSVVTVESLSRDLDTSLFIVSPGTGRFTPLEATAAQTGLPIVRATRHLDAQLLAGNDSFFNGHVPVTAMVTLLGAMAAVASGRGGVVMSNEHSASVPNLEWSGREVNHQWSKSLAAEVLIAEALTERLGDQLTVASFLRARSEVWVAQVFSELPQYHHVFRSCNRAFRQSVDQRDGSWCGECDKCLFINLALAPHLSRASLTEIFGHEPLSDPARDNQLRVLVGLGTEAKPFECVGDPDESAVALKMVSRMAEWRDVPRLAEIADNTSPSRGFDELLEPQGSDRVPAHWLR
ncbi:MAG: hypothetical protein WA359_11060 [Acidimicrobiales bacterium]